MTRSDRGMLRCHGLVCLAMKRVGRVDASDGRPGIQHMSKKSVSRRGAAVGITGVDCLAVGGDVVCAQLHGPPFATKNDSSRSAVPSWAGCAHRMWPRFLHPGPRCSRQTPRQGAGCTSPKRGFELKKELSDNQSGIGLLRAALLLVMRKHLPQAERQAPK